MKDRYNRNIDYLRLSVTDNCNLRCVYCMEEDTKDFLDIKKRITDEEIIKILKATSELGIKKVRITGGEPLVRKGVVELVGAIKEISGIEDIYMTTNGILLKDKVTQLARNGLKGVNISLDSLNPNTFKRLTKYGELKDVLEAIDKCLAVDIKVKLNVVMIKDINSDEILDFIEMTRNKGITVRFIELMPIGVGKKFIGIKNDEIIEMINKNYETIEILPKTMGEGPAKYIKIKGALGSIGFISAISNCFCKDCNRIRITSEGFLKQCLHYKYGVNLKEIIDSGISQNELEEVIKRNIYNKPEMHLFNSKAKGKEEKSMNEIGG